MTSTSPDVIDNEIQVKFEFGGHLNYGPFYMQAYSIVVGLKVKQFFLKVAMLHTELKGIEH